MVANTNIPDIMDSMVYEESVAASENPSDPEFLEHAMYLQEHGYFKELTALELREKLRDLYREKNAAKSIDTSDVWK